MGFHGIWTDENDTRIIVTHRDAVVYATYETGDRGPFTGVALELGSPVVYVNFTDDRAFTGVMTVDKSQILWSNSTVWTRASA